MGLPPVQVQMDDDNPSRCVLTILWVDGLISLLLQTLVDWWSKSVAQALGTGLSVPVSRVKTPIIPVSGGLEGRLGAFLV